MKLCHVKQPTSRNIYVVWARQPELNSADARKPAYPYAGTGPKMGKSHLSDTLIIARINLTSRQLQASHQAPRVRQGLRHCSICIFGSKEIFWRFVFCISAGCYGYCLARLKLYGREGKPLISHDTYKHVTRKVYRLF